MNAVVASEFDLKKQITLLANIEPTEVNFLTCYLDTSSGWSEAQKNFESLQKKFRGYLKNQSLHDFDHSVRMVEDYMTNLKNHPAPQSVAIFCRSILGGQYFSVISLNRLIGNKLVFNPKPAIQTLLQGKLYKQHSAAVLFQHRPEISQEKNVKRSAELPAANIARDQDSYHVDQQPEKTHWQHISKGSFDLVA